MRASALPFALRFMTLTATTLEGERLTLVLSLAYLHTSLAPRTLADYGSVRPTGAAATPRRTAEHWRH